MLVGFSVAEIDGRVQFQLHGEDTAQRLVTFAQRNHVSAALMGRLYYREELGFRAESDADLAIEAYCRGIVERLEGDFCLVIWDSEKKRLFAARDPLGGFPLYWATHAGKVAVSTAIDPLLAGLPKRELSMSYLAGPGGRSWQSRKMPVKTASTGIHRVVPGP